MALNNVTVLDDSLMETGESETFWMKMNEVRFVHAFIASISVIIVSELGDKTFFIAAIMAMRHNRWVVFAAATGALVLMTLLSVALGMVTNVIPREVTHYLSTALFVIFGLKMLREGYLMSDEEGKEEYEEVQRSLSKKAADDATNSAEQGISGSPDKDPESVSIARPTCTTRIRRKLLSCFSLVFIQTLSMTMVAEWGDRSQFATIILAAREDVIGVTMGAIMGHALCTALAVIGGRFIAMVISVRTVTLIGGVIFIMFAFTALLLGK